MWSRFAACFSGFLRCASPKRLDFAFGMTGSQRQRKNDRGRKAGWPQKGSRGTKGEPRFATLQQPVLLPPYLFSILAGGAIHKFFKRMIKILGMLKKGGIPEFRFNKL